MSVVVVLAVTVAGCSGEAPGGEPGATRTAAAPTLSPPEAAPAQPSVSPAVTAEPAQPTPTLRPLPAEATELSEAGAVAFLLWWVDMYNYVEATGETELVFQHSEPDCTFCQNFVDRVEPVYASGGRIERRGRTSVSDVRTGGIDNNDYLVATSTIASGPSLEYSASGERIRETRGEDPAFEAVVGLQWRGAAWQVADVGAAQ